MIHRRYIALLTSRVGVVGGRFDRLISLGIQASRFIERQKIGFAGIDFSPTELLLRFSALLHTKYLV